MRTRSRPPRTERRCRPESRYQAQGSLSLAPVRFAGIWSQAVGRGKRIRLGESLYGLDGLDLGDVMADQALDAALQGDRRGRAALASTLHAQIKRAVLVAAIDDVAAILRDRRADAG